jgi:hypothetical protein
VATIVPLSAMAIVVSTKDGLVYSSAT